MFDDTYIYGGRSIPKPSPSIADLIHRRRGACAILLCCAFDCSQFESSSGFGFLSLDLSSDFAPHLAFRLILFLGDLEGIRFRSGWDSTGAGDENKTGTSEPSFGHDRLKSSMGISLMLLLSQNRIDLFFCVFLVRLMFVLYSLFESAVLR